MCRIAGSVSSEPVSLRRELLDCENPLIHQSEQHDSGWGLAVYERADGVPPRVERFPVAAYEDERFEAATRLEGRIFNVHVRRATIGGLREENTHPFAYDRLSFSHNGTVLRFARLLRHHGELQPAGDTDSEALFCALVENFDAADPVASLRSLMTETIRLSPFSGLNVLLGDGERLFAYKLGLYGLHWVARPGQLVVSSEVLTEDERWHAVHDDVLLILDPDDLEEPHAVRLVGDRVLRAAQIQRWEDGAELQGEERGRFAEARARALRAS